MSDSPKYNSFPTKRALVFQAGAFGMALCVLFFICVINAVPDNLYWWLGVLLGIAICHLVITVNKLSRGTTWSPIIIVAIVSVISLFILIWNHDFLKTIFSGLPTGGLISIVGYAIYAGMPVFKKMWEKAE